MHPSPSERLRKATPESLRRLVPSAIKRRLPQSSAPVLPVDLPQEFRPLYERCRPFTLTSVERMYGLYEATRYVVGEQIRGDFVECGVWRGGSSMLVALTLRSLGHTDRQLYLYDTYAGMSRPSTADGADTLASWEQQQRGDHNDWSYVPLEEVQRHLLDTEFPPERLHFVVGKVEESIPATVPADIALLRLDTDFYESTLHELRHLYPRLTPGGVLLIDDYGYWKGARAAVDEYLAELDPRPMLVRIDNTGRLAIKPPRRP